MGSTPPPPKSSLHVRRLHTPKASHHPRVHSTSIIIRTPGAVALALANARCLRRAPRHGRTGRRERARSRASRRPTPSTPLPSNSNGARDRRDGLALPPSMLKISLELSEPPPKRPPPPPPPPPPESPKVPGGSALATFSSNATESSAAELPCRCSSSPTEQIRILLTSSLRPAASSYPPSAERVGLSTTVVLSITLDSPAAAGRCRLPGALVRSLAVPCSAPIAAPAVAPISPSTESSTRSDRNPHQPPP